MNAALIVAATIHPYSDSGVPCPECYPPMWLLWAMPLALLALALAFEFAFLAAIAYKERPTKKHRSRQ